MLTSKKLIWGEGPKIKNPKKNKNKIKKSF